MAHRVSLSKVLRVFCRRCDVQRGGGGVCSSVSLHRHYTTQQQQQQQKIQQQQQQLSFRRHYTTGGETSLPSPSWPEEAVQLYHQLHALTLDGSWIKIRRWPDQDSERRGMMTATGEKMFSGAMFLCPQENIAKSVIIFGPWLQGGLNHVHGGGIAAVHDSNIGMCSNITVGPSVTANLNINFKKGLVLGSATLATSKVERVEGRKVYLSSVLTSCDGSVVYSDATALFILLKDYL